MHCKTAAKLLAVVTNIPGMQLDQYRDINNRQVSWYVLFSISLIGITA
jgi:hypothetical protein